MAQATLPGLLSVLRPVVVPTRNRRSHPPHPAPCARPGPDESGLPRRSARGFPHHKEPSAAGTSRVVRWFNPIVARHRPRPIVARASNYPAIVIAMLLNRRRVGGGLAGDRAPPGDGRVRSCPSSRVHEPRRFYGPTDLLGQCEQVGRSLAHDDDLRTWLRDEEAQLLTLLLTTDVDASGRSWTPKSPGASCDLLRRSMVDSRGPEILLAYPVNAARFLRTTFVFGWSAPSSRSESASVRSRRGSPRPSVPQPDRPSRGCSAMSGCRGARRPAATRRRASAQGGGSARPSAPHPGRPSRGCPAMSRCSGGRRHLVARRADFLESRS